MTNRNRELCGPGHESEAGLRAQVDSLFIVVAADPSAGWVQMVWGAWGGPVG